MVTGLRLAGRLALAALIGVTIGAGILAIALAVIVLTNQGG